MNKMSVKWKLVFFLLVLVTTLDPLARPHRHRRKLNVHKTFRRRPGRLQSVLCTFNLRLCLPGRQCAGKIFEFPKIFFFWKWHFGMCFLLLLHKKSYINAIKSFQSVVHFSALLFGFSLKQCYLRYCSSQQTTDTWL